MQNLTITKENESFLLNGKKLNECTEVEKNFFTAFIKSNKKTVNRILYKKPKDVEILK